MLKSFSKKFLPVILVLCIKCATKLAISLETEKQNALKILYYYGMKPFFLLCKDVAGPSRLLAGLQWWLVEYFIDVDLGQNLSESCTFYEEIVSCQRNNAYLCTVNKHRV